MAGAVATISGTALRPGVSRNGRLYTADHIAEMVRRAQDRIDAGVLPVTMRTSHPALEANAPVTEIVGRVTRIWQETDGSARFQADIADTSEGRQVAALVDVRDGRPFVSGVSIRGAWIGTPRRVVHDGQAAETADGVDLDGIDFTHKPGVDGARVDQFAPAGGRGTAEAARGRVLILEEAPDADVSVQPPALPDVPLHTLPRSEADAVLRDRWSAVFAEQNARRPRSPFWRG